MKKPSFKNVSVSNLSQKALLLAAAAITLGLAVRGAEVVLENADKTGVAILLVVLLGYAVVVNVKRFVK